MISRHGFKKPLKILSSIFIVWTAVHLVSPAAFSEEIKAGLSDEELLETISRKSFDYFLQERTPKTGLVRDSAHNFKKGASRSEASIAATGFALTAYGVGVERGWIDRGTAYEMTRQTLDFFLRHAAQEHGFFYHFLNMETGARVRRSELSPIDTALFLGGVLFAAEYFDEPGIRDLADQIYGRVDWPWMLHGGEAFAMAWSPETGFDKRRWDHYDESSLLYLLAIGSPAHPIPSSSWQAVSRPVGSYEGYRVIHMPPLFTHQYSHVWIDFRDKNDGFADYFQNSVNASLANRAFCMRQAAQFSGYGPNAWGLTACNGPFGYKAYGAPPGWAVHDGTLAPTGCGASIVFTPQESLACLRHYYENFGERLWGLYGFSDAFNADKNWFDENVIGIDQGALLLMIENYRSGLIWNVMNKNAYLKEAMNKVGFRPGTKEIPWPDPPVYEAPYFSQGIKVDGYLKDWPQSKAILLDRSFREFGQVNDDKDLSAEIRFGWSEEALYFSAKVNDDSILVKRVGADIWRDDVIEIYVDPQGDGLYWYDPADFQIGFRPHREDDSVEMWSWFQGKDGEVPGSMIAARGFVDKDSYLVEGGIRWAYLGIDPSQVSKVKLSVALHDADLDRGEAKLQWFFRNEEEWKRFNLGDLVLKKK